MRKNTISCLCTIRKNKDDTNHKYKTQYRGNNGVGDQYHIDLTGMVPYQGCQTCSYVSTALCDLFAISDTSKTANTLIHRGKKATVRKKIVMKQESDQLK